jgi:hypothetical protein
MTVKEDSYIGAVLIIILTACMVSSGCTSTQTHNSVQSNPPITVIPSQTLIPKTAIETPVNSLVPITTSAPIISPTITPINYGVTLTLNSAEKQKSFGIGTGKPGRVMLILDISLKNNNKNQDFEYSDNSFIISYNSNDDTKTSITSQYAKKLINPLISGFVPSGSTSTGKILFGVNETSNSYKLSVVDSTGTELASVDNINLP